MMLKYPILLISMFTLLACKNESGEFLFDLDYPNNRATLNLTLGISTGYVLSLGPLNTNLEALLVAATTAKDEVSLIQSGSATLSSVDGIDLDFIDELRITLCLPEENSNCSIELFHLDNIPFSKDRSIRLQPGITNLKEFLINREEFNVELELTRLRDFPLERDIRLQLDFTLEVRK